MAELVINTPQSRETVDLDETPFTIGRQDENSYTFKDPQLSRRHCVIRQNDDKFTLEDLDSKNGTIVNGVDTDRTVLKDGDHIVVGDLDIEFQHSPGGRTEQSSPADRSRSSKPGSSGRLVHWVNPFQITSPAPGSNSFLSGAILSVGVLALIVIGGFLLLQPLQSDHANENLLGPSDDVIRDPARWELDGASRETVGNDNRVFQLPLSPDQLHATAHYSAPLEVEPSSWYEFTARISTRNLKGLAGIHVRWIGSDGTTVYEELVLPTQEQSNWVRTSSRPLKPPPDARRIEFSLFASGNQGIALFDEPVLRKMSTPGQSDQRIRHQLDQFPLSIDRSGQVLSTGSNGGRLLQSGLRFWKDGQRSPGWTTSIMNRREQGNDILWSGSAFTPIAFHPVNVKLSFSDEPPQFTYSFPGSLQQAVDKIGFQLQYQNGQSSDQVKLLTGGQRVPGEPGSAYSNVQGIEVPLEPESVLFQFSHPLSVRLNSNTGNITSIYASMSISSFRQESRKPGNEALQLRFKVHPADRTIDLATRQSDRSPAELRNLIESGNYDEALTILQGLRPFKELKNNRSNFQQLHAELLRRIESSIERAREDLAAARELNSTTFVQNGLDQVQKLRERLGSHQDNWDLSDLHQKLREARKNVGTTGDENRVNELYDTFNLYRESGRTELARDLASEIVQRAPSTEKGRRARSFIEQNSDSSTETRNGNGNSN